MTDLDLPAIEARARAATTGEWKLFHEGETLSIYVNRVDDIVHWSGFDASRQNTWAQKIKDATFIAQSKADILLLCAALREREAKIAELEAALRAIHEMYSHTWDRADGDLVMMASSIPKFEAAHKRVREALGIKWLEEGNKQ